MLKSQITVLLFIFAGLLFSCKTTSDIVDPITPTDTTTVYVKTDVKSWLTSPWQSKYFVRQNIELNFHDSDNGLSTITVDSTLKYQTMDGFGFALTGGSATLINKLPTLKKDSLLHELFDTTKNNIGINYLRISIGASDLSSYVYSYDDVSSPNTDTELKNFSLSPDMYDLIPVLKSIIAINPSIKILGSPWSAPAWMKDNKKAAGGSLLKEYFSTYADYFVKYIQEMKVNGINIDAVTVQNEPLNPYNNPSMYMSAEDQTEFIKNHLGPKFKANNIKTKIICYDHNCDVPAYPITVLTDPDANQYVDGSAFHLYLGDISALTTVHDKFPEKNVYFTEQWVGGPGNFQEDLKWHVKNLIVGATRNWSKNVIEWNLASDPNYDPHTNGGCTTCMGALTIGSKITRNVSYYIVAHASKFVPDGSVRIASNLISDLPNVAFLTPSGQKVLIVLNNHSSAELRFNIQFKGKYATATLSPGAISTFIW